jgi:hypothetical protein
MTRTSLALGAALLAFCALTAEAQGPLTRAAPTARALGPEIARTTQTFARIQAAITLGGSVFVNDPGSRQLWMIDSSLKTSRVVLDSASGTGRLNWYGQGAPLTPFRRFKADSLMFTTSTQDALLFGAEGRVTRVAAMPGADMASCQYTDMDANGWLVCQSTMALVKGKPTGSKTGNDSLVTPSRVDSMMVLGVNFRTWDVDTIVRIQAAPRIQYLIEKATSLRTVSVNPVVSLVDAWAIFNDGTLAVARAVDYHLDIYNNKGEVTRGPKAPYDWRRLTDADKDRMVDSLRVLDSTNIRRTDSLMAANGSPPPLVPRTGPQRLPPDEWPSFYPPFQAGNPTLLPLRMATDLNDRIWVAEAKPVATDSTQVYGVFDRKGAFVDRVRIPARHTLVGFGPNNAVYLSVMEANRATLVKVRFK